jgi:hypothetical protein
LYQILTQFDLVSASVFTSDDRFREVDGLAGLGLWSQDSCWDWDSSPRTIVGTERDWDSGPNSGPGQGPPVTAWENGLQSPVRDSLWLGPLIGRPHMGTLIRSLFCTRAPQLCIQKLSQTFTLRRMCLSRRAARARHGGRAPKRFAVTLEMVALVAHSSPMQAAHRRGPRLAQVSPLPAAVRKCAASADSHGRATPARRSQRHEALARSPHTRTLGCE